jgi:hypothetical protein
MNEKALMSFLRYQNESAPCIRPQSVDKLSGDQGAKSLGTLLFVPDFSTI